MVERRCVLQVNNESLRMGDYSPALWIREGKTNFFIFELISKPGVRL
jgi:hypothetical protein